MPADRHWAEIVAERLLVGLGWRVLARNYRLRGGELDLVCSEADGTVVFVEVRQRSSLRFGGAAESLDARKLTRLRRTADHFLTYGLLAQDGGRASLDERRVRFDAVLVTGVEGRHHTSHVKDVL